MARRRFSLTVFPVVLLTLLTVTPAFGRSIYGTISHWDWRANSNLDGSLHTGSEGIRPFWRGAIMAWKRVGCIDFADGCGESNDGYIGWTYTDYNGNYSIPNVSDGDLVYLVFPWIVEGGYVKDSNGATPDYIYTSATLCLYSNVNKSWNLSCWGNGDASCTSAEAYGTYSVTTNYTNVLAGISQSRRYLGSFSYNGYSSRITGYYPNYNGQCTGVTGRMLSEDEFCITDSSAGHVISHELGHCLHARWMMFDDATYGPLTECVAGQYGFSTEFVGDRCNVAEGFATFVSAVSYWEVDAPSPYYIGGDNLLEGDTDLGNGEDNDLACISYSSDPHHYMGNSARFFWDLYDETEIGADDPTYDVVDDSYATIIGVWDDFTRGASCDTPDDCDEDHEVDEEDWDGVRYDGRNAHDYRYWASNPWVYFPLYINCLDDQSN